MTKRSREEIWGPPCADYPDHAAYLRMLPCAVSCNECHGAVAAHHVVTIGAGGLAKDNLVPLCIAHHTGGMAPAFPVHQGRETFAGHYGIDLAAEATRLWTAHYGEETEDE